MMYATPLLNNKQSNFLKLAKDLNRHSIKKDKQAANEHVKMCLTSLVIKEVQITTIMRQMRQHYTD
jgi:hypothetical protein